MGEEVSEGETIRRFKEDGGEGGGGRRGGGDGRAEKLHFDGGKLNQLCNGGLGAIRRSCQQ